MRNPKHLLILASVALIFVIASLFSVPTDDEISGAGDHVFPELLPRVNDVTYIKIQKNDGTLTLTKDQDIWRIKENDGYPADINKVRELVLGIGNMKRVEPKTRKPESYSRIGLQDVTEAGATSTQVTLIAGSDKKLADVLIGNSKVSKSDTAQKSYYIRTLDDPQTWLADGNVPDKWEPKDWLNIDVFEVKRDRIQQVKVSHEDGEIVYVHRDNPQVRDFILESLKADEQVTAPYEVNNIATTFTKMTFDDVNNVVNAQVGDKPIYTAVLTTFDGLEVTFQPFKKGDNHLVKYSASYNEAVAKAYLEKKSQQGDQTAEPPATSDDPHSKPPEEPVELKTEAEVKQEVEKYNALWKDWMYQLPNFRINNIGKKKADLLKKNDAPVH